MLYGYNCANRFFFLGKAKVKLENKGDLSFFAKQDEAVSTHYLLSDSCTQCNFAFTTTLLLEEEKVIF